MVPSLDYGLTILDVYSFLSTKKCIFFNNEGWPAGAPQGFTGSNPTSSYKNQWYIHIYNTTGDSRDVQGFAVCAHGE